MIEAILINKYFTDMDEAIEWVNNLVGSYVLSSPRYERYMIERIINFQFVFGNMIVLVEILYKPQIINEIDNQ